MIDFEKLSKDQLAIADKIVAEAEKQGVDPNLMLAIAFSESGFKHADGKKITTSPAGAIGVLQLMPETAKALKINPRDLDDNIRGGVMLMKENLGTYGNPTDAVIAYNTSTDTRNRYLETRDLSLLPNETLSYLERINSIYPLESARYVTQAERIAAEGEPDLGEGPKTTTEQLAEMAPEAGAAIGAVTGYLEKKAGLPGPPKSPDVDAAQRKLQVAEEKLRIAQDRYANQRVGIGQTIADLETEFQQKQSAANKAAEELRQATERARAQGARNVRAPVPTPSQHERITLGTIDESGTTGRARQTGYTEQTAQQAARRAEAARVQEELARRGLVAKESVYTRAPGMTSTPAGVVIPADTVYEPSKATVAAESDLERSKRSAGEAQKAAKDAERRLAAERAKAARMTGQVPASVARAEDVARAAKFEAELAKRTGEGKLAKIGRGVSKIPGTSVLGGLGAGLSAQEAIERWNAGDRSAAVISALNAVFAGMSLVPHPMIRGIGTVGGLMMAPLQYATD